MKLKAWTIMELIIVMMLTSIVITSAIAAYNILGKMYRRYETKTAAIVQHDNLHGLFIHDFSESEKIYYKHPTIECVRDSQTVIYDITDKYVTRQQATVVDTFLYDYITFEAFFSGEKITSNRLIDVFDVRYTLQHKKLHYRYAKEYDAKTLMQYGD